MARLNHVCMWNGKQWQRITAEEAGKSFLIPFLQRVIYLYVSYVDKALF